VSLNDLGRSDGRMRQRLHQADQCDGGATDEVLKGFIGYITGNIS